MNPHLKATQQVIFLYSLMNKVYSIKAFRESNICGNLISAKL
jgi:hypothetical protein